MHAGPQCIQPPNKECVRCRVWIQQKLLKHRSTRAWRTSSTAIAKAASILARILSHTHFQTSHYFHKESLTRVFSLAVPKTAGGCGTHSPQLCDVLYETGTGLGGQALVQCSKHGRSRGREVIPIVKARSSSHNAERLNTVNLSLYCMVHAWCLDGGKGSALYTKLSSPPARP